MTTIVYRDGELAGDTRITDGETILPGHTRKVFRLKDGSLFGSSDDNEGGELLLHSLRKGLPPPKLKDDESVQGIHIRPRGDVWFYEGNLWIRQHAPYYAIGTGSAFALGALCLGASASEAVRAGIRHDVYSGGKVQTVKLGRKR